MTSYFAALTLYPRDIEQVWENARMQSIDRGRCFDSKIDMSMSTV
jgi:hypothetical protein